MIKRVYRVASGDKVLYSTRLRDVLRFISRVLLSVRGYASFALKFEVYRYE